MRARRPISGRKKLLVPWEEDLPTSAPAAPERGSFPAKSTVLLALDIAKDRATWKMAVGDYKWETAKARVSSPLNEQSEGSRVGELCQCPSQLGRGLARLRRGDHGHGAGSALLVSPMLSVVGAATRAAWDQRGERTPESASWSPHGSIAVRTRSFDGCWTKIVTSPLSYCFIGDPYGNRTRVSAVRGPRPNR